MKKLLLCLLAVGQIAVACTAADKPDKGAATGAGRPETKPLEAASAVGYDGKAIRNSVDATLNKNDDRTKEVGK